MKNNERKEKDEKKTSTMLSNYYAIMPYAAVAVKRLGGHAERHKVLYQIMLDMDIPPRGFKKINEQISWAGSRLRRLGILETERKQWILKKEYIQLSDEDLLNVVRERHKAALNGTLI